MKQANRSGKSDLSDRSDRSDNAKPPAHPPGATRVMAFLHALFAGAQLLLGAMFAHSANLVPNATGVWSLRMEGAAMVAGGGVLVCIALGMARLRQWTNRVAVVYAAATLMWSSAAILANVTLRITGTFDPPRNLFGLLLVILVHAIALLYDVTRKPSKQED